MFVHSLPAALACCMYTPAHVLRPALPPSHGLCCLAVFAFVYATGPVEVSHIDDLIALNQETCPATTTAHIVRARDSLHTCVLVCLATLPAVLALTVWYGWRATASASRELDLVSTVDLAQIDVEVGEEPPIALDAPADCQAGDADSTASSGTARRRRGCGVSQACQPWFALTMALVVALLASQCYALVVNATASAEIDAFYESARGLGGQCVTHARCETTARDDTGAVVTTVSPCTVAALDVQMVMAVVVSAVTLLSVVAHDLTGGVMCIRPDLRGASRR